MEWNFDFLEEAVELDATESTAWFLVGAGWILGGW